MVDHEQGKKAGNSEEPASSCAAGETTAADYLRTARALLLGGRQTEAFEVLQHAAVKHAEHPILLSYFGWLDAVVKRRYRSGIEVCLNAIAMMEKRSLHGEVDDSATINAMLYLNLGRAYLAAGKKEEAVDAFAKGLKHNRANAGILKEMRTMGIRKKVPLSFLGRSNPVNKYLGILLHRSQSRPGACS